MERAVLAFVNIKGSGKMMCDQYSAGGEEDEDDDDIDEGNPFGGGASCSTCNDWKYVYDASGNRVPCPRCNSDD
jgi:hypothetical protein